jgi:putative hydrolase of the HAD superfamily
LHEGDVVAVIRERDQLIERIYCYRAIGHKKPSLEFFSHILADLRLPPDQVVMVGDLFEADVQGAIRAGIRSVWLNEQTGEAPRGEAYRTIHALRQLPGALEDLFLNNF